MSLTKDVIGKEGNFPFAGKFMVHLLIDGKEFAAGIGLKGTGPEIDHQAQVLLESVYRTFRKQVFKCKYETPEEDEQIINDFIYTEPSLLVQ